jgi:hypothetical protein
MPLGKKIIASLESSPQPSKSDGTSMTKVHTKTVHAQVMTSADIEFSPIVHGEDIYTREYQERENLNMK